MGAPNRKSAGYTYVGVMVLIVVLTLASAAVLSAGSAMQRRLHEEELLFVGGEFAAAFKSYSEATPIGQSSHPQNLAALLRDPRYPSLRRHLRKIYVDPITGSAEWGLIAVPGGIVGVHSLSKQSPIKVDNFEPAFAPLAYKKNYAEWAFGYLPPGVVLPGAVVLAGAPSVVVNPEPQQQKYVPSGSLGADTPLVEVPIKR